MSIIKSFSVGDGDMFYIKHNSKNFSIIDCYMDESNQEEIVNEIKIEKVDKKVTRFISTHPDEDHLKGLKYLDEKIDILFLSVLERMYMYICLVMSIIMIYHFYLIKAKRIASGETMLAHLKRGVNDGNENTFL